MNKGKDLTEVRSPQRKLAPDNVGLDQSEQTFLRGIAIKAKSNKRHRFRDLYRCLNEELIYDAWKSLNKGAASGVDRVTAETYAEDLQGNIQRLVERLKAKRYRTKLVRRVYIPKENGKQRPLGIHALEDRLVQSAVTKVLTAIYEQDFLDCSYGYRAGRSAHDAVSELTRELQFGPYHMVVEADIRGFFDHMDHDWLLEMLEQRIDDRAFLGLRALDIHGWGKRASNRIVIVYPEVHFVVARIGFDNAAVTIGRRLAISCQMHGEIGSGNLRSDRIVNWIWWWITQQILSECETAGCKLNGLCTVVDNGDICSVIDINPNDICCASRIIKIEISFSRITD